MIKIIKLTEICRVSLCRSSIVLIGLLSANPALANIIPDTTLPVNSKVTSKDNIRIIDAGTIRGENLFHSFQDFSFSTLTSEVTGNTAFFNNDVGIKNIITRVTGGLASNIDGIIKANGSANLFILNPVGILFGQNARLDIGGSFVGTTASGIKFADGTFFDAAPTQQSLLTISTPVGLQLDQNSNAVVNTGNLAVKTGQSLSLLGSAVVNTGELKAPGGEIALVSLNNAGNVSSDNTELQLQGEQIDDVSLSPLLANLPTNTNGEVELSGLAIPKGAGTTIATGNIDVSGQQGGIVKILGHQVGLYPGASINASGDWGGGKVFLGGDYKGVGSFNANATYISPQATVQANAVSAGNGGQIIVWSNDSTRAYGSLEAKGGAQFGNGGLIETSSANFLDVAGIKVNATAANGIGGTWLLDPRNILLAYQNYDNVDPSNGNPNIFTATGDNAVVDIFDIQTQLEAGTSVTISTGSTGNQEGNISTITDGFGITKTTASPVTLTLQAANDITLGGNGGFGINSQNGTFNVILQAGRNISINKGGFQVTSGGEFKATAGDTISLNNSGINNGALSINLQAGRNISIKNGGIQARGGELRAKAGSNISISNAGINSNNFTANNAQTIQLEAPVINISDAGLNSKAEGNGNAASIIFNTPNLTLSSAGIESLTTSNGKAGDIIITSDKIALLKDAGIGSNTEGAGRAGNITINTKELSLENRGAIKSYTLGTGNAGIININADSLFLSNQVGINTDTGLVIGADGRRIVDNTGNAGEINITAKRILITKDSGITSETASRGQAGLINIKTDSLELRNNANITTSTFFDRRFTGNAGTIDITAKSVLFENDIPGVNSGLGSATRGRGDGGTITLNTDTAIFRNQGGIGISTEGEGSAGTLFLIANSLLIENAGIESEDKGSGRGGNLNFTINGKMVLRNANISVSARPTDNTNLNNATSSAGNIDITANSLSLDRSLIQGETTSGNGGNIALNVQDILSLRRQSQISTTAGTDGAGGNGGNININTKFIIAYPNENSDITANAFNGSGGNVNINARSIFGTAPLSRQQLQKLRPNDLNPRQLFTNDITAVSQTNPSLSGIVTINTPDVDPSRGLVELPSGVTDASQQIVSTCNPDTKFIANSFTVRGGGGIPPSPINVLQPHIQTGRLVTLDSGSTSIKKVSSTTNTKIVEAQGWVKQTNGDVILVAQASNLPKNSFASHHLCR
jgi:filamentous hemagglutinin family protein